MEIQRNMAGTKQESTSVMEWEVEKCPRPSGGLRSSSVAHKVPEKSEMTFVERLPPKNKAMNETFVDGGQSVV